MEPQEQFNKTTMTTRACPPKRSRCVTWKVHNINATKNTELATVIASPIFNIPLYLGTPRIVNEVVDGTCGKRKRYEPIKEEEEGTMTHQQHRLYCDEQPFSLRLFPNTFIARSGHCGLYVVYYGLYCMRVLIGVTLRGTSHTTKTLVTISPLSGTCSSGWASFCPVDTLLNHAKKHNDTVIFDFSVRIFAVADGPMRNIRPEITETSCSEAELRKRIQENLSIHREKYKETSRRLITDPRDKYSNPFMSPHSLPTHMSSLRSSSNFYDVTINFQGTDFNAHLCVLLIRVPKLYKICIENGKKTDPEDKKRLIVHIKSRVLVDTDMDMLLDYVYTDQVPYRDIKKLFTLVQIALLFECKTLVESIDHYLSILANHANCIPLLKLNNIMDHLPKLKTVIHSMINNHDSLRVRVVNFAKESDDSKLLGDLVEGTNHFRYQQVSVYNSRHPRNDANGQKLAIDTSSNTKITVILNEFQSPCVFLTKKTM